MRIENSAALPFWLLGAICLAAGLLDSARPDWFFPALPLGWILVICSAGFLFFSSTAFGRWKRVSVRRKKSKELLSRVAALRQTAFLAEENDVDLAGRNISRLVRNSDEDLREIRPDFSFDSIERLRRVLPFLLDEIHNEESARIRLGVVGTYLGEFLCRSGQWQWFFKCDPALRQFGYLTSVVRREGRELDPYAWAALLFSGSRKSVDFLKESQ